ncbi:MAG: transcription antitermination factor NusB [Nitrospirae bacterium]|nr:transcription antitermination factor NusB [Nitrospirota bacterium]
MGNRRKARECALQMMFQLDITHDPRYLQERYWDENLVSEPIRDYANELVTGTLNHLSEIDSLISKYAENWTLTRMGRIDRNVLRIAVFELLYRDDIPARVTLDEAIVIAKKFAEESSGAFINGILDKILKEDPKMTKKAASPVHVHPDDVGDSSI